MSRGSVIYGVLRHATEKEMLVAGVRADLAHIDKPREAVELGGLLGHYLEKLAYRMENVKTVLDMKPMVRVMTMDGVTITEGLLQSVNPGDAKVFIRKPGSRGRAKGVVYARALPIPDKLAEEGQRFYGLQQLVRFKVLSSGGSDSTWRWL